MNHKNLLAAPLICLVLFACSNTATPQVKEISNQELIQLMDDGDLQLVDVRTPEETSMGMIEGARNINFRGDDFKAQISRLDKKKPIAVYCGAGGRSGKTSEMLVEMGFQQIYDLNQGFGGWQDENLPVKIPE